MPSRIDLANAVRALAMDAVQAANSGHPGMPMGMADIAEVLWNDYLKHNPADPTWPDRDRFVVSNGHGSMLLYALLHLSGYDLSLDELRNFRQLGSKTPGHPEHGLTPGVETTTGPLGQGLANAVGFALAEKCLAAEFNRDDFAVVDHHTYVLAGDGCLMEGISHEACSLAGTLALGKLIVLYDDNDISIDGDVDGWFRDDTASRFEAYGWQVIRNVNGHDAAEVEQALESARAETNQPSLIQCKTIIGFGAPNKQGSEATHGAPLGDEEIAAAREHLGWPHAAFEIPDRVRAGWDGRVTGASKQAAWSKLMDRYAAAHPELAAELRRRLAGDLPAQFSAEFAATLAATQADNPKMATRKASLTALNELGPRLPELIGGSADLTGSNLTLWKGATTLEPGGEGGSYIYYGVREFGMAAIMNGLALHGGFIPYGGTFLVFSDYARNGIRMAALMEQRSIFVLTHDSIGLGEDGPTHQPVEHLSSLRLIPNLHVWRSCDTVETFAAWQAAIERHSGPAVLALTRQNVEPQPRDAQQLADIRRGGYVLYEPEGDAEALIIATGSEVELATAAAQALAEEGRRVRVVSMPCADLFLAQDADYINSVLPPEISKRLAVEAGVTLYWRAFVGMSGDVIGVDRFGESAPGDQVFEHFGITAEDVTRRMQAMLA